MWFCLSIRYLQIFATLLHYHWDYFILVTNMIAFEIIIIEKLVEKSQYMKNQSFLIFFGKNAKRNIFYHIKEDMFF